MEVSDSLSIHTSALLFHRNTFKREDFVFDAIGTHERLLKTVLVVRERAQGKTTELIKIAEREKAVFVTPHGRHHIRYDYVQTVYNETSMHRIRGYKAVVFDDLDYFMRSAFPSENYTFKEMAEFMNKLTNNRLIAASFTGEEPSNAEKFILDL